MAIKVGFYGAECYDLIHYVSRTLYHMDVGSILLLDISANQSLTCSIPYPEGYTDDEIDYRGITFSSRPTQEMMLDYDIVLIYFGYEPSHWRVDYAFIVSSCQLHEVAAAQETLEYIKFTGLPQEEKTETYLKGVLNLIVLGSGATTRERFIAQQMQIPLSRCQAIDLDDVNMECRLFCQYDVCFKFIRISEIYKEVIEKMCMTIAGNKANAKLLKKAIKIAERGK